MKKAIRNPSSSHPLDVAEALEDVHEDDIYQSHILILLADLYRRVAEIKEPLK